MSIQDSYNSYKESKNNIANLISDILSKGELTQDDKDLLTRYRNANNADYVNFQDYVADSQNAMNEKKYIEGNSKNSHFTQEEVFNFLTNNGETQGIFIDEETKQLYINAEFIQTKGWRIVDDNGNVMMEFDKNNNRLVVSGDIKGATIEGSIFKNELGTFLIDSNGNIKGATINGGSININNCFTVDSQGRVNINSGVFKVSTTGNLQIGGSVVFDTTKGIFEVTSQGNAYFRNKDDKDIYTKVEDGKITIAGKYTGSGVTTKVTVEDGQLVLSDTDGNRIRISPGTISGNLLVEGKLSVSQDFGAKNIIVGEYLKVNSWPGYGSGTADLWFDGNSKVLVFQNVSSLKVGENEVLHRGNVPKRGNWFSGGAPVISTDGVMEVGKYIDFHTSSGATTDYDARLTCTGGNTVQLDNGVFVTDNIITSNLKATGEYKFSCANVSPGATDKHVLKWRDSGGSVYLNCAVGGEARLGTQALDFNILYARNGVNQSSDRSIKENINYIDDTINLLNRNVSTQESITHTDLYNFVKDDLYLATYNYVNEDATRLGFIAQDLLVNQDQTENKVGNLLIESKEAYEENATLHYNLNTYINILGGALKESINEIENLKKENTDLKNRLKLIEEKLGII